jgi:PAS domain S-box-containing protein
MVLWCGKELVMLYNDAWRPVLGATKHPIALGRPGKEIWAEIWDIIGEQLNRVLSTGEATWSEDLLLLVDRYGYTEETYFTYSYSPIFLETGEIGGAFTAVAETTQRVLGERRTKTLRDLAERVGLTKTVEQACQLAIETLTDNPNDIPFAMLYLVSEDGKEAQLCKSTPTEAGEIATPKVIDLTQIQNEKTNWPFASVVQAGSTIVVEDLQQKFGAMPSGAWKSSPSQALILPLHAVGQEQLAGLLVVGVNPCRVLDDDYRDFFEMSAGHIANAIANADAYEAERKRAEALAEIDRAKTTFFSNVSHEFRTPLALMLSPLEEMLENNLESVNVEREQLALIHRNGLRLHKLVNTLLDFSRIEAGRIQAVYEPTDLATYTAELASAFRSALERAGLVFRVDCPPLGETAYVDREMWEKIVFNLLSNAFKFTLAGEIAVSVRSFQNRIILEVRDTGTGIPSEELPHIFERFHRVKGAKGRTHEGSGIGLSLIQELVKLHGGTIEATSIVDRGSCFRVSIPAGSAHLASDRIKATRNLSSTALGAMPYVEEALRWQPIEVESRKSKVVSQKTFGIRHSAEGKNKDSPLSSKSTLSPKSSEGRSPIPTSAYILIADDNADMRDYLKRLLGKNYQVETVADGIAALESVRSHLPDLLLTDVMMPRLDGFELLQQLRDDPQTREVPIILLSARAGEESSVEGLEAGADDYLIKPFSTRELLARVESNLKMARMRQEAAMRERELREASEAARRNAQKAYQQIDRILENMTDAFVALDPDWRIIYMNAAAEQINQKPRSEVLGKTLWEEWPASVGTNIERQYRRAMGEQIPVHFEHRYYSPPDYDVWLEIHAYPSENGLGLFYRDISDRKQTQAALTEQERRYRYIFESVGVSVWEEDWTQLKIEVEQLKTQGLQDFRAYIAEHPEFVNRAIELIRLLDVNHATVQMFEAQNKQQMLASFDRIFLPETTETFIGELLALAAGDTYYSCEMVLQTLLGRRIEVLLTMTFPSAGEPFDRVLVTLMDITERKQAEVALTQNQERLNLALKSAPITLFNQDRELRYTWIYNPALGYQVDEVIGKRDAELMLSGDASVLTQIKRQVIETGIGTRQEVKVSWQGKDFYYDLIVEPLRNANDEIIGVTCANVDISERKQTELSLRKSETLLDAILNASPVGLAFLDRELRYIHVNEAIATINGIPLESHLDRTIWEVLPDWAPFGAQMLQRVMETKEPRLGWEYSGKVTQTADYRHCLVNFYPVCLPDGEVLGVGVTSVDITQLKQTEQALRASEAIARARAQELATILETVPVAVWIARDPQCHNAIANRTAYEVMRRPPGSIATATPADGEYPFEFQQKVNGQDISLDELPIQKAARTGQEVEAELELIFNDGEVRYIYGKAVPLRDEFGEVRGAMGAFLDVSDRKRTLLQLQQQAEELMRLNTTLRQTTQQLAKRNQELDKFAYVVSHDLKAPLRAISNLSTWIEEDLDNRLTPENQRHMELLRGRVFRLEALIDGLLAYSRIGRFEVPQEIVNVAQMLAEIVNSLAPPPTFTIIIHPIMPTFTTKKLLLFQVFSNLISNAINHCDRPDGRIEIFVRHGAQNYEFSVVDNGPGISPEYHERIFVIFQTLKGRDVKENTGIGLSIVKKIVETEGGEIAIESELGKGTTFRFTWPKQPIS